MTNKDRTRMRMMFAYCMFGFTVVFNHIGVSNIIIYLFGFVTAINFLAAIMGFFLEKEDNA